MRLFNLLSAKPAITFPRVIALLRASKPTAIHTLAVLRKLAVNQETTGKQQDRVYKSRAQEST